MDINKIETTVKKIRVLQKRCNELLYNSYRKDITLDRPWLRDPNCQYAVAELVGFDSQLSCFGRDLFGDGEVAERLYNRVAPLYEAYQREVESFYAELLQEAEKELAALCNPTVNNVVINGAKNVTIIPEDEDL